MAILGERAAQVVDRVTNPTEKAIRAATNRRYVASSFLAGFLERASKRFSELASDIRKVHDEKGSEVGAVLGGIAGIGLGAAEATANGAASAAKTVVRGR